MPNSEARNTTNYGVLKLTLHAKGATTGSSSQRAAGPSPTPAAPPATRSHHHLLRLHRRHHHRRLRLRLRSGLLPSAPVSSATADRGTSLTLAKPVGTLQGDVLIAVIAHQVGQFRNMTAPAGWAPVPNTDWADGNNARIHAWYKLAGSVEPASYTFPLTGGSGQDISGGMLAVDDASQAAPINASGGQSNGPGATVLVTAPSITTSVANTLLVFGGGCANNHTFTPPPGVSELWDRGTTSQNSKVSTEAATQPIGGAGPTGTRVATLSSSCKNVAINIAVAPLSTDVTFGMTRFRRRAAFLQPARRLTILGSQSSLLPSRSQSLAPQLPLPWSPAQRVPIRRAKR